MKAKNLYLVLSILMGTIVVLSNFLVQFPFTFYGLEEILTYGAFSYPVAFLITDLANRRYGKIAARKIVYLGFFIGVIMSVLLSNKNLDLISLRIAIGSGTAFLFAQLLDVKIFDILRDKIWFLPPLVSSLTSSVVDTFLFFSISFYATDINWITLALGDLSIKILVALVMLIPFKIFLNYIFIPNTNKNF